MRQIIAEDTMVSVGAFQPFLKGSRVRRWFRALLGLSPERALARAWNVKN